MQNTKFKAGQTVWCLLYGKGKVSEIDGTGAFPVAVTFDSGESDAYSAEGQIIYGTNRTLFHSEPRVIAETEPVFEPKLVGKTVVVYSQGTTVHTGEVTAEDSEEVVTQDYAWPKRSYIFREVNPQPYTFD